MSAREFAEWIAYSRLDPFGNERGDFRNAMLCQLVDSKMPGKGKKLNVDDFMPKFEKALKNQTQEEIGDTILAWAHQMNAMHGSGKKSR